MELDEVLIGIKNEELTLFYQPIINLSTNQIVGYEGLARWLHPQKGVIAPRLFIPPLEKKGISHLLCYKVVQIAAANPSPDGTFLGINIPISTLIRPEWKSLEQTLDPRIHHIELPESNRFNRTAEEVVLTMRQGRFKFAADDFGDGYFNFQNMSRQFFDFLKLDISITEAITVSTEARIKCKAIIELAHLLGLLVIAEGVEIEEQVELLRGMGCDMGQGFYWGLPSPQFL